MKKVLVSGATGFIGNYVVQQLLQNNCSVIATSANEDRAKTCSWFKQVQYIPFRLEYFDAAVDYFRFFNQPDIMIHLAWEGLPNYKSSFHFDVNLPRHFSFLKNMIQHGLQDLTVTGTCFEYGMQEGRLQEDMPVFPANAYAKAKNTLREFLQDFQHQHPFILKWIRLFYMFGEGQNPNSLLSQLDKALDAQAPIFNMSGGEQVRDYLPVEKVAEYIVKIVLQRQITGIINCCSGEPVKIKDFVKKYLARNNKTIALNLGYYPYPDYEPMHFWGDDTKLKNILKMNNPIQTFIEERKQRIKSNNSNKPLQEAATVFNVESNKAQYSYNFSWMGRPIIQYPQDMMAMQEIIWELKPDLIIETGIAHGGSLIYYASLLELIGNGEVLGIDIDIREHNRREIEKHPMYKRIKMLQGSSVDEKVVQLVKEFTKDKQTVLVSLDSNHTHEHVLQELQYYSTFVTPGSYIVVFDTIVQDLPQGYFKEQRPWGIDNNPKTAVLEFLKHNKQFVIDTAIDNKLLISVAPEGYLKRIK